MDLANGVVADHEELLEGQAHVWNQTFSFVNSMSLKCAIQLGIPDIIHNHGKPMTQNELVKALNIHPTKGHCIPRLMRVLINSGFFAQEKIKEETSYVLTNASKHLLQSNSTREFPFTLLVLDPAITSPFHALSTWFSNDDQTPFQTRHGKLLWDYMANEPSLASTFYDAMEADSQQVSRIMVENCKGMLEGVKLLVDVGGGTGAIARDIANAFPQIKCTVFDLPHLACDFQGTRNLDFVGGDMFEFIPPANAIVLKWVLHDWPDEDCVKILTRCREAIESTNEGGKLIIIEIVIESQESSKQPINETKLFFDMLMMVEVNGKERDEQEWEKLFLAAGFTQYKMRPMFGLRSLIEVYP
ncbi:O-methyltransferase domain [Dillenia turbinata]|uniref:O-methyltransferase domain n=1 Tax=Dillenia turbinata TaxID=194707 RepID=A0AAN8Z0C0_9MAGN